MGKARQDSARAQRIVECRLILDTVDGLSNAIHDSGVIFGSGNVNIRSALFDGQGGSYTGIGLQFKVLSLSTPVPALFRYTCIQCDAVWSVVVYPSVNDLQIALLPAHFAVGGVASANTPKGVAFYLDQAARCHSVSANTAAVSMLRSALEWLLEDQGFTEKMLGPKLVALDKALRQGTAPPWAREIEPEYLQVIKDLGNVAIHTNSGDLAHQEAFDRKLYRQVELTFLELLEAIYERPARRAQRLAELKSAADHKSAKKGK